MPTSPGPLLDALTALWDRIRADVRDLPPALLAISPTTRRQDHGPERWGRDVDGAVTGLVVTADVLHEGAEAVLTMVLHDAAHILNWTRDVKDTAMYGAYHNQAFLPAAEEVGLVWPEGSQRTTSKGFSAVMLGDEARERHVADLRQIERDIPLILPHLALPSTSSRTDRLTLRCTCSPPRSFRISRTVAAQGAIRCDVCGTAFTEK